MYHNGVSEFCIPSTSDLCNQVLGGLEMPGSLMAWVFVGAAWTEWNGMEWNGMVGWIFARP